MAKLEWQTSRYDFDTLWNRITDGILNGSASATLVDRSDFAGDGARCSVTVFERYSMIGGNRLSLTVTLFQAAGGPVCLSGITAGAVRRCSSR